MRDEGNSLSTVSEIPARWRWPIRVSVIIVILLHMALFMSGAEVMIENFGTPCPADDPCLSLRLTPAEFEVLAGIGISARGHGIFQFGVEVFGLMVGLTLIILLMWRASHTWIGVMTSLAIIFLSTVVGNAATAGVTRLPLLATVFGVSLSGFILVSYIFPTGHFNPRWTRWLVGIALPMMLLSAPGFFANNFFDITAVNVFSTLFYWSAVLLILVAVGVQGYRYRRIYDATQKVQARWFILGLIAAIIGTTAWTLLYESTTLVPYGLGRVYRNMLLTPILSQLAVNAIPVALAIAILRYRLFDIDVIIRRTLIYSILTAILAGVYFGGVTLLQTLFTNITGSDSTLAVVISTLGIAALFRPVQVRVQRFIDRRFFRQNYDAARILADFADAVRDEIDVEDVEAALLRAVDQTLQPESVGLWLREGSET